MGVKFNIRIHGEDDIQKRLWEGFDEIRVIKQWVIAAKSVEEIKSNSKSSSQIMADTHERK
jgi:hypothetical protein